MTAKRPNSTLRTVKGGHLIEIQKNFGRFGDIDGDIEKTATPEELRKAICRRPEISPELAKKLQKGRPLGRQNLRSIMQVAERAVFDIKTRKEYILNERVELSGKRAYQLGLGSTIVPSIPVPREGCLYLCLAVHRPKSGLRCKLAVVTLSVAGDKRTVVVPSHVCDRLEKRAGIKGSHVAFVARSVIRSGVKIRLQKDKIEPVLTIFGWDKEVLGYCPIAHYECKLQPSSQPSNKGMAQVLERQRRWRLKSFLLPHMVKLLEK